MHLAEDEIAAFGRASRVAPRVVPGRPLDQADHQRDLFRRKILQLLAEPEFGRRRDAADRLRTALPQVDLVEIRLQDGALVVTRFQQQGEEDFLDLAGDRLLLADAEQAAARKLLGQRARPLLGVAARLHGDEGRAQHAAEIDAHVAVEVAVFDRLQAFDQERRDVANAHQSAFLLVLAVQGGHARRVQPRAAQRALAGDIANRRDVAAGQCHFQDGRRDPAIDIVVASAGNPPARAVAVVGAGAPAIAITVRGGIQLGLQGLRVHRQPGAQHQRTRVHAGRHLPAQLAEALADLVVQVQHVRDQEAEQQRRGSKPPGQQAVAPDGALRIGAVAIVVVQVVFVFDAGHGRLGWRRFRGMRQCRVRFRRV